MSGDHSVEKIGGAAMAAIDEVHGAHSTALVLRDRGLNARFDAAIRAPRQLLIEVEDVEVEGRRAA